jgi:hypothetical protein
MAELAKTEGASTTEKRPWRDRARARVEKLNTNAAWFVGSTVVALAGLLFTWIWPDTSKHGLNVLIFAAGLITGLWRLLWREQKDTARKVDDLTEASRITPLKLRGVDLNPLAAAIWEKEGESYAKRFKRLTDEGSLPAEGNAEVLYYLNALTKKAERTIEAVDHTDIHVWSDDPRLKKYLDEQLAREKEEGISLTRIRLVKEAELEVAKDREALVELVRRHDDADATLLLCLEDEATAENIGLTPAEGGMLVIDRDDIPAGLVGRITKKGRLEGATVYFKAAGGMQDAIRGYEAIKERIEHHQLDEHVRDRLGLRERPATTAGTQSTNGSSEK